MAGLALFNCQKRGIAKGSFKFMRLTPKDVKEAHSERRDLTMNILGP